MPRHRMRLVALILSLTAGSFAAAQSVGPYNEREVKPAANVQDGEGDQADQVWMLDFVFKDPRLITVDVPGRGRKVIWYLWYQVINRTNEPHTFVPSFDLVTLDKHTVHHDQVLPKVMEAIKRREDPTGYLDIKNSVTIAAQPIPPTKPDSVPRAVTGVAVWDDVFGDAPDTTRFSIFVSGLSNGWSIAQKDGKKTLRIKTLQLDFKRLSDRFHLDAEVQFQSPYQWIYRVSDIALPDEVLPEEKKAN